MKKVKEPHGTILLTKSSEFVIMYASMAKSAQ
jgi:hypothetical protein